MESSVDILWEMIQGIHEKRPERILGECAILWKKLLKKIVDFVDNPQRNLRSISGIILAITLCKISRGNPGEILEDFLDRFSAELLKKYPKKSFEKSLENFQRKSLELGGFLRD